MKDKNLVRTGSLLIWIGLSALLGMSTSRSSWPLSVIAVGGVFLLAAMLYHIGGLAIPGTLLTGLGVILLGQNITGQWSSWLVVWPLVPGLVGLGLVAAKMLGMPGRHVLRAGLVWFGLSLLMVALMCFLKILLPFWFSWALILVGLGAMFVLAAPATGVPAQAIPGMIIGGTGVLLYWQNLTGLWASWSYAWALIPGFVGIGLALANLLGMGGRTVRQVGLHMMAWSGIAFLTFGLFFALNGMLIRYWPLVLIVGGVWILWLTYRPGSRGSGTAAV